MFKELKTDEEKDSPSTLAIIHLAGMEPLPSEKVSVVMNFGRTIVIENSTGKSYEGDHIVMTGRTEDVQNYLKNVKLIILGIGNPLFEQFEIIKNS